MHQLMSRRACHSSLCCANDIICASRSVPAALSTLPESASALPLFQSRAISSSSCATWFERSIRKPMALSRTAMGALPERHAASADSTREAAIPAPSETSRSAARSTRLMSSSTTTHCARSTAEGSAAHACSAARTCSPASPRCHAASARADESSLAPQLMITSAIRTCSRRRSSGEEPTSRHIDTEAS